MKIIRSITSMRNRIKEMRKKAKTIGFAPTMGCLHQGHISLAHQSVKECDVTVMSIYVNPMQFGPREDYKKYPRDLKKDVELAKKAGVDYLFVPSDKNMYPEGFSSKVSVTNVTERLCGASRPGHFEGVTTVVLKLFNIIMPDTAYFGQKDAQQAIVIKKMVKDLNMPLKIKTLPIVREDDGLAISSRNSYLSKPQRLRALSLYQALSKARQMIQQGERNPGKIIFKMKRLLRRGKFVKIDYIVIVDVPYDGSSHPEAFPYNHAWFFRVDTADTNYQNGDILTISGAPVNGADDVFSFKVDGINASLAQAELEDIRVVPDPYFGRASGTSPGWEASKYEHVIQFQNLPDKCSVRIYTISGDLVRTLDHNPGDGGTVEWDMLSEDRLSISSGIYLYHVESQYGNHVGRFAVIK